MRGIVYCLMVAAAISSSAAGSAYAPGFVWDRSVDWTPGLAPSLGYQYGNPAPDAAGGPAWAYEHVFAAGDLGDAHPWFENAPVHLTWDPAWFGGLEAWTRGNDNGPPIFSTSLTHMISIQDFFDRVPVVRWMNPTGDDCTVDIAGDLTLHWTGNQNFEVPVDISAVIVMSTRDRTFTRLYAEVHADPSPGDQNIGVKKVPINLKGVQVPIGGALLISVRGSKPVIGRWCDMDDNLTITLKSLEGGCTADIDGNGVLDLFDFLGFVNLFNAGC